MGLGSITWFQGKLHYQNYRQGAVFAPFAMFVGALIVFVAIKGKGF